MEISQEKLNDLVTNWFERYQSVIYLSEGGFEPFGYSEVADNATQKEVGEAGLDWEVYQALNANHLDALEVYRTQVKLGLSKIDDPHYELYSGTGKLLLASSSLENIVNSWAFEDEVRKKLDPIEFIGIADEEAKKQSSYFSVITAEALTETQSFMDEEEYWRDKEELIPVHDENLIMLNDFFVAPTPDLLLKVAYELNPKEVDIGIETYEDFFDELVETEDDYVFWSKVGSGELSLREFVSSFSVEHDTLTAEYGDELDWEELNKNFNKLLEENRTDYLENKMLNDQLEM